MRLLMCAFLLLMFLPCVTAELHIVDSGPPFYLEPKGEGSYTHFPFEQYDHSETPYVNQERLLRAEERFERYLTIQEELGYNAMVLGDLHRLTTFQELALYPDESTFLLRALQYQEFFKRLTSSHPDFTFFINADFQPWDPFIGEYVGQDESKREQLNSVMLEELFTELPDVDGIMIRIGEGGSSYATGAGYQSRVVKDLEEVERLLSTLLPICERHGKLLILRVWTVGLGDIGSLSSNPVLYEELLAPFEESENLLISIKHTDGDFWSFVPENKLLGRGSLPQLVEYQLRREYEGYGTLAYSTMDQFEKMLLRARQNPNYVGTYQWLLFGGWDSAENIPYFSEAGLWTELEQEMASLIVQGFSVTEARTAVIEGRFAKENVAVMEQLLSMADQSRQLLYVPSYAADSLTFREVRLHPQLFFYWDRPSHDHLGLFHLALKTAPEEWNTTIAAREQLFPLLREAALFLPDGSYHEEYLALLSAHKLLGISYYRYLISPEEPRYKEAIPLLESAIDQYSAHHPLQLDESRSLLWSAKTIGQRTAWLLVAFFLFLGGAWPRKEEWQNRLCYFGALAITVATLTIPVSILSFLSIPLTLVVGWFHLVASTLFSKEREPAAIRSLSLFGALVLLFIFRFIPERFWLLFYQGIFGGPLPWAFLFLFFGAMLFKSYLLKCDLRHTILLLLFNTSLLVLLLLFLVGGYLFFFPELNAIFHFFPSILESHGMGPELLPFG
jgi:hypothetical protein